MIESGWLWVRVLKAAGDFGATQAELDQGYALLNLNRRTLHSTEIAEIYRTLPDLELVRWVVELLAHEADLLRLLGDADSAAASARWTLSMLLHGAPPGDYSTLMRALLALAERQTPPEPL